MKRRKPFCTQFCTQTKIVCTINCFCFVRSLFCLHPLTLAAACSEIVHVQGKKSEMLGHVHGDGGNVFEAVMTQPVGLVALGHVVAKIRKQASDAGVIASHWLLHPALHARGFDAVLLGSTWRLRPSGHNSETSLQDWPRMHASQFAAVTGLGSVSSVRVSQ